MLENIEPKEVFKYFELLSSVPRGSGNTKQVSDLCVNFAREHGLDWYQDELNNVIIRKNASVGYEDHEPVIIQGHLDMVCAKTANSRLDMSKYPITLLHENDFIFADETTLGGDDGIAVAMAMAVLASDTIKHPSIEAVFTVDEETGMDGATGIDASQIKGRKLLNIDSEDEGIFTCGCAGGVRVNAELPVKRLCDGLGHYASSDDIQQFEFYKVKLDGLLGGHSGCDIDKNRASATYTLGAVLYEICTVCTIYLSNIFGGKFDNVIADNSNSLVGVAPEDSEKFEGLISLYDERLKEQFGQDEPGLHLYCEQVPRTELTFSYEPLTAESTKEALGVLHYLPQGVRSMSSKIPGLVETSANLGILRLEKNLLKFSCSVRSSIKERKDAVVEEIKDLLELSGGRITTHGEYPGWDFMENSPLRDTCVQVFREQYEREPVVEAIHAGLECGIFMEKLPGLDAISFGPDLTDIHTPSEKLSISSTARVWKMLIGILEKL